MTAALAGGEPEPVAEVADGAHMSFSPDCSRIMDVVGHRALWCSPLDGGAPRKVFEFDDPDSRIDYPVWSPDGRWVLFDRFVPQGGDVWAVAEQVAPRARGATGSGQVPHASTTFAVIWDELIAPSVGGFSGRPRECSIS